MNNESVILIVDDLANNLKVISSVLKNDYKISLASSGKMALKILENATPDLILLDIMMPDMDGYETIKLIKQNQRLKDIPVIFLTAKTEIDDIVKGFDLGAVDYITKPFNQREVKVRIRNQIMLKNALEENKQHNLELQTKNREIHELNDELIKRNEDLQKSESKLNDILMTINDGVWSISWPDMKILYLSPSIESIYGYSTKEFTENAKLLQNITHPEDRISIENTISELLKSGSASSERRVIRKDGVVLWVQDKSYLIYDDGKPIKVVGVVSNITERKQAEEQLLKLSQAVEQSPASVVITDIKGRIEYVNPKFSQITGYTLSEAKGQNPRILKSGEHTAEFYKKLWLTISSGKEWFGELYNKKKNGEYFWESASISPIINSKGRILHYLSVKKDITLQKEYELTISRQNNDLQKLNAEKDKFFSLIAHDLRSPLGGIMQLSEFMKDEYGDLPDEEKFNMVNSIHKSTKNVFKLLVNLLDWSRIQRGIIEFEPENYKLYNLVSESIIDMYNLAIKKEIILKVDIDDSIIINCDKNMMMSTFRNLTSNAIKFTPSQGKVVIGADKDAERLLINITDNGIGMSDKIKNNLFNIEVNTSRKGTEGEASSGLGLILCKEFVEKHNGDISVESTEGEGSTFILKFPV